MIYYRFEDDSSSSSSSEESFRSWITVSSSASSRTEHTSGYETEAYSSRIENVTPTFDVDEPYCSTPESDGYLTDGPPYDRLANVNHVNPELVVNPYFIDPANQEYPNHQEVHVVALADWNLEEAWNKLDEAKMKEASASREKTSASREEASAAREEDDDAGPSSKSSKHTEQQDSDYNMDELNDLCWLI